MNYIMLCFKFVGRAPARQSGGRRFKSRSSQFFFVHPKFFFQICDRSSTHLFLKEVGLPVSHAVNFWQREYSQTACCPGDNAGCTHDWKRDSRRYTYSIRHLYGLEGSRVNYRAHSCCSLQVCNKSLGPSGELINRSQIIGQINLQLRITEGIF